MKLVTFAGSLRKDSLNKRLAKGVAQSQGGEFVDLQPLSIPVYDADIETEGIPAGVVTLARFVRAADALIVAGPEYNGTITGVLKNAIDWLSRVKPLPLDSKPILLLSASPGALGGVRSLWHTRQAFEVLGCHVYPGMLGVPKAHEAFDANNSLVDERLRVQLQQLVSAFLAHASKITG
jgi:chromate reductase, NAD(P)H dehydrogenase (quinone)